MKRFRLILNITRIVVALLFAANFIFMVQLYNSIKGRYVDDVEQCLRRAEQIEIVDRIVNAGLADDDNTVRIELGLLKSDVGDAKSQEELRAAGYSQGYRRMDRQLISLIAEYLHEDYDDLLGEPDLVNMDKAFRRDLSFSGYYPKQVHITLSPEEYRADSNLWEIKYKVADGLTYYAFISPLTANIFREMSGVIITSVLIALVLTLGFWYLLHVIHRLRTLEEMKDDFTNNMTHELKTPISIAYAASDALLQFPDPKDEERTRKYLNAALEQLTKLSGLVESIMAMSMERRKHLVMAREDIQLNTFLTAIVEQHKLKARKPCAITLVCPQDAVVSADPTHFSNVINNLLDNSVKYSGTSVTIVIKADSSGISVKDNGLGIPGKSLPEIFNKFYRVPHGNRNEVRGYGIGLYYVKSIVDKHGWQIKAESTPGKGSKFIITFK